MARLCGSRVWVLLHPRSTALRKVDAHEWVEMWKGVEELAMAQCVCSQRCFNKGMRTSVGLRMRRVREKKRCGEWRVRRKMGELLWRKSQVMKDLCRPHPLPRKWNQGTLSFI